MPAKAIEFDYKAFHAVTTLDDYFIGFRDGMFSSAEIKMLHAHCMQRRDLGFSPQATPEENPILVAGYSTIVAPHYKQLYTAVQSLLPLGYMFNKMQIVYSNFAEVRRVHTDGAGITALYFANPDWHPDHLGEVLFYRQGDPDEVGSAVSPIPGRIVVFSSALAHRSGTPSILCRRPRVVVVFRFNRG